LILGEKLGCRLVLEVSPPPGGRGGGGGWLLGYWVLGPVHSVSDLPDLLLNLVQL
jgi:hypothetical protein